MSTNAHTWEWDFGDVTFSNLQNPSHTYTAIGTYTVTLTVGDTISNCVDVHSINLVVGDVEPPVLGCPSQVPVFENSQCLFELPNYGQLYFQGDNCDPSPTIVQFPPPGTFIGEPTTITVYITDASNNVDSCEFTATPEPSENPSFSYPNPVVCSDDTIQVATVTGTPGGTFSNLPIGLLIDPSTGEIDVISSLPGEYTIYYTTPGICPIEGEFTIEIAEVPAPQYESETACFEYTWAENGTTYNTSGTYMQTHVTVDGCDSIFVLDLIINQVDTNVIEETFSLAAAAINADYQWLDCDNDFTPINNETGQTFLPAFNGSYAVQITQNGCVDTSACYLIEGLGIIDNDFGLAMNAYPNPTTGLININLDQIYDQVSVKLMSLNHQTILTSTYSAVQKISLEMEVSDGIYLLEIKSDTGKTALLRVMKN